MFACSRPGPGACPRKATTCERFTATITQFSRKRSTFIGLYGNNLTLLTPVNIFIRTAAWAWLITPVCCPYPGAPTRVILGLCQPRYLATVEVECKSYVRPRVPSVTRKISIPGAYNRCNYIKFCDLTFRSLWSICFVEFIRIARWSVCIFMWYAGRAIRRANI